MGKQGQDLTVESGERAKQSGDRMPKRQGVHGNECRAQRFAKSEEIGANAVSFCGAKGEQKLLTEAVTLGHGRAGFG